MRSNSSWAGKAARASWRRRAGRGREPDQWNAEVRLQVSDNCQGLAESPLEFRSCGRPWCDRVHAGVSAGTRKLVAR